MKHYVGESEALYFCLSTNHLIILSAIDNHILIFSSSMSRNASSNVLSVRDLEELCKEVISNMDCLWELGIILSLTSKRAALHMPRTVEEQRHPECGIETKNGSNNFFFHCTPTVPPSLVVGFDLSFQVHLNSADKFKSKSIEIRLTNLNPNYGILKIQNLISSWMESIKTIWIN